ncbi:GNAT family N-acetyltransferase [Acinetobacter gerneri]|uniref:N-acetyltransferase domain-containing protein n=1 Tax=Acinetobacter gerneri DSM 14967 = CIP 107464 = MTCC 9824 TaxID=1120926 RepID=N8YBT4_9GAMM|nr:GNAT family N-acetyltransferase [Acinetobacter gerneri]ENV34242.1 hypothetical protein F960_01560 [Acinetobacter gerneri DSM 14967 = CIP 107464 = MTCC 9824]EPR85028.1 acetyltransferase, GNAT family [Acinetobacter gerneri DSM 14967 = CIP 107464 = MTCC 9824]
MKTNKSIRPTKISDIADLIEIERSAAQAFLATDYAWIATSPVLSSEEHQALIENDYAFVIANSEDRAIAFIYAQKMANDLYIIELDVVSNMQKQGLGRLLLNHMIDIAKKQAFDAVTLTTFVDVAWNHDFYQKLGFEKLDRISLLDYLEKILKQEQASGFPREKRCAMLLNIS